MDLPDVQERRHGGVYARGRRALLAAPFLLPLLAVVGVLLSGLGAWCPVIAALVVAVACLLRLWRIAVGTLLCALVVWLHAELRASRSQELCLLLSQHDAVRLGGTVEKKLSNGVVFSTGIVSPSVLVRGENDLRGGERAELLVEPTFPPETALPGMFDAKRWMRGQGIAAECRLIRVETRSQTMSLYRLRAFCLAVRDSLAARLMPPGTEADSARQVLCALVLGARDRADEDTLEAFQRGGCLHAFAVSGLHVGLFSGICLCLLRWLRIPPGWSRPLLLLGVGLYVAVTGASVPSLRAYLLLVVLVGALMLRRRAQLLNTWSFAALVVLLAAPSQLYNAGFLLSFAVYAALCIGLHFCLKDSPWFAPDAYIPARLYTRREHLQRQFDLWVRGVVVVALSAWLVATPLSLLVFHTFNPWSVLTNIAITPILPVVMLLGLLHLALGWVPGVALLTDWLATKSAGILLSVVAGFGGLPEAWLPACAPAEGQEMLIVGCDYGQSFTVLGNPGLLINPGSEADVRFRTRGAVFHSGFTPAGILRTRAGKRHADGAETLLSYYPDARILGAEELPAAQMTILRTSAGEFTCYPAPPDYPRRLTDSRAPVVHWARPGCESVLYLGNAPAEAWYRLPVSARRAGVVILGRHPVQPIGVQELRESGASVVVLLPAAAESISPEQVAPAVLIEMQQQDWLRLRPDGAELNGLKWSAP